MNVNVNGSRGKAGKKRGKKHHDCEWWVMGRETVTGGLRGGCC